MTISRKHVNDRLASLGARLRRARLQANLSQSALASRTGVALKTIANAEDHGRVSLATLLRLLEGLGRGTEIDALLVDGEPSPVELLRRKGKPRQRARSRTNESEESGWQW